MLTTHFQATCQVRIQGARRTSDAETPRHVAAAVGASPGKAAAAQRAFTLSYAGAFVACIELLQPPLAPRPPGSQLVGLVHLAPGAAGGDAARCHEVRPRPRVSWPGLCEPAAGLPNEICPSM